MDKIKAYEELLNRALYSLRLATYYDYVNRREANKLYDDIKKALKAPMTEASPCEFCKYDNSGNPCIACPATAKEDKDG